jgi:carbon storage regulator
VLILSRRPGDAIVIAGNIRVVVMACDRRGVRLGIAAPSDISVLREEIVEEIAAQNRQASVAATPSWLNVQPLTTPKSDKQENK